MTTGFAKGCDIANVLAIATETLHRGMGYRRTLICLRDAHGAFIETFGHDTGKNLVEVARLAQRGLARVTVDRALRLVDLRGDGLARLGADNALAAGEDYAVAQAWSGALHDHPRKPDGVVYRSRHDPSRFCAALFDHVAPHVRARPVGSSLADPRNIKRLADLLDTYGFGLV